MKPAGLAVSVWALCILAAGALCVGCPKQGPYEQTQSYTATIADGGMVKINNFRGNISVRGWDAQQVSVVAKKKVVLMGAEDKPDQEGGRRYLDLVQVKVWEDGQSVTVEATSDFRLGSEMSVDFEVIVPRHAIVQIANGDGDVDCADFDAKVTISAGTGNVRCNYVRGDADVSLGEGNITCGDISGSLKLVTTRGYVDVLHPAPLPAKGGISCVATEGGISLGLSATEAFKLDAHTAAGRILVAPEFAVAPQNSAIGSDISVSVNGGSIPFRLRPVRATSKWA